MQIKHIDIYCERLSSEFWAEPINALSNLAFIIVGLWILKEACKKPTSKIIYILSCLLISIGFGSFLFHTYADNRTHLADLIPIFVFTSTYLFYALIHFLNWSKKKASAALVGFVISMALIEVFVPKSILNGSLLYAPPLLMLLYISYNLSVLGYKNAARRFAAAVYVFVFSLGMRTVDMMVCDLIPMGTHFMWHIMNAVFLGILMFVALRFDELKK